jgi:hypothetical protein
MQRQKQNKVYLLSIDALPSQYIIHMKSQFTDKSTIQNVGRILKQLNNDNLRFEPRNKSEL